MGDVEITSDAEDLAAFENDMRLLGHETAKVGKRAVRELGVTVAVMLALALAVWIILRRLRVR